MHIPNNVQYVLEQLHLKGHEAYIVGGCVRDMILGIVPQDYDVTTSAEPEEVKAIFPRTIDTGIEHGTVTVMIDKEGFEVTTYRIDGDYLDHRRPDTVLFTKSLEEDLKRRDFTINAMAYNEEEGIIDHFNGQEDLELGILRCVGVAQERFTEDALRMLRAIRFAARFAFVIEASTAKAIGELNHLIQNISGERVRMELTKILCSKHPEYIEYLVTYGLLEHVIPEFMPCVGLAQNHPYHVYDVDRHTYECLKNVRAEEGLRWAVYLHDIGKGYAKTTDDHGIDHFHGHPTISVAKADVILKRLKFDNRTKKRVLLLIAYHDYRFAANLKSVRRAMAKIGKDLFMEYLDVQVADIKGQNPDKEAVRMVEIGLKAQLYEEVLALEQCVEIKDLTIGGEDLIAAGLPRGKVIGEVLNHLLDLVIESPDKNQASVLLKEVEIYLRNRGQNEVE